MILKKNQILKWADREMSSGACHSRNCQSDLKTQVVLSEWELCIQDSLLENCISGITPCLKLKTDSFDLQSDDSWPDYRCHASDWCESGKVELTTETDYRKVAVANFIQSTKQFILWGIRKMTWVRCSIPRRIRQEHAFHRGIWRTTAEVNSLLHTRPRRSLEIPFKNNSVF